MKQFLKARANFDLDYKFPKKFYVALSHNHLPREVVVESMKKICDTGWIRELIHKSFVEAESAIQRTRGDIARESKEAEIKERKELFQIDEMIKKDEKLPAPLRPVPVPVKTIKRIKR